MAHPLGWSMAGRLYGFSGLACGRLSKDVQGGDAIGLGIGGKVEDVVDKGFDYGMTSTTCLGRLHFSAMRHPTGE